jgi:hypothetical protein
VLERSKTNFLQIVKKLMQYSRNLPKMYSEFQ